MFKKKPFKVVIVGAGPIGCYTARLLKLREIEPLLIEEHKELGRPVHCAGLVGKKVFEEPQLPLPKKSILNIINGAGIALEKEEVSIERNEVAYVIDREKFDKSLGEGLNILFGTKFLGLEKENGCYIVETDRGDIPADIVIGADGAKSAVREYVNAAQMEYLKGVQFRMEYEVNNKHIVRIFIKKPYFYWIIPEQEGIVRIGVLSKTPYQDLLNFLKEKKINGKILEKFAGMVPLTHFISLSKDRVFLVGDSAAQIKPLTYGGIYMGMRSAELLADCLAKEKFKEYTVAWQKKFGREISIPLKAREIFYKLSDKDIKKIFSFMKKNVKIIEKKGDFENHSLLAWELLKQPAVSKDILSILFKILKANFS